MKLTPCGESSTSRSVFMPRRHFFLGPWKLASNRGGKSNKSSINDFYVYEAYSVPDTTLAYNISLNTHNNPIVQILLAIP